MNKFSMFMEYYVSDQPNKNGVPCKPEVCADVITAQNKFMQSLILK